MEQRNGRGGGKSRPSDSMTPWGQQPYQQQQQPQVYYQMPVAYYTEYPQQTYTVWPSSSAAGYHHPAMPVPAYPGLMQQHQHWAGHPPPPPPPKPPQQQPPAFGGAGTAPRSSMSSSDDLPCVDESTETASTSAASDHRHPPPPPPPPPMHWQPCAPHAYFVPPHAAPHIGPMMHYGHYPQYSQHPQQQQYTSVAYYAPHPNQQQQVSTAVARSGGHASTSAASHSLAAAAPHHVSLSQWALQQQRVAEQQRGAGPPRQQRPLRAAPAAARGGAAAAAAGSLSADAPDAAAAAAGPFVEELCGAGSDDDSDDGGAGPSTSAAAAVVSPNFEILAGAPSEDWRSLTEGLLQRIVLRLGGEDVKQVRLVGRHWRAVVDHNLEQLSPSLMQSAVIVTRFRNLKALHLTNCANVRNRDLMIFAKSGLRLHTLTLGDDTTKPWVTNKGLAYIAQMPTLTALHLQDCNSVTNNGIARLNALQGLASLSLKGCRKLTNSGLEPLQENTALTSLNLFGCVKIGDKGLAPLTALSLVTLTLGLTRVKDEGVGYLAAMTSLQELSFSHEEVTDTGLKQLSRLTNLHSLALREIRSVSGEALVEVVPQLASLQSLDLFRNFHFSDDHMLRCLDAVGSVTSLDLRGTAVTQDGINQLSQLGGLQKLCVQPPSLDLWEPYLLVLANLTQLVSLTINNCTVLSMRLLGSLRPLNRLLELDLSDDKFPAGLEPREQVEQQHVEVMASLSSLTSLDLSRRPIGEQHLAVLAERLPRLRSLIVVGCPVHNDELLSLQRRFPDLAIHRKPLGEGLSCSSSEMGL